LERAEHLARLLEVNLNLMLDHSATPADRRWRRVLECMGQAPKNELPFDTHRFTQLMCVDRANLSSIASCIGSARENARQVREQISSEMWEQLNRLFLEVYRHRPGDDWNAEPMTFLAGVQEGSWLFQGITNAMMNHGEGWHFIRLGRYTERALNLTNLLDVHFAAIAPGAADAHIEWLGLLKSASAFEAYCK
ncbi:MAG TPA: hypothetical protein DEH78_22390, partial [Solibacterales bacterium]|nr:hypothetical protein [Bryobacterales bacterium]